MTSFEYEIAGRCHSLRLSFEQFKEIMHMARTSDLDSKGAAFRMCKEKIMELRRNEHA